jgi:phosphatidylserine/phosphatidylglycerophosphate/cardiolipin synthase-like enzyme
VDFDTTGQLLIVSVDFDTTGQLLIVSVDFDTTGQLLIMYCAFVKYLRKNGDTMRQCISCLYDSVRREVLYDIIIDFVITIELVRIIKMCLNEAGNRVWIG